MHNLKAVAILSSLTGLFLAVGYMTGGQNGMVLAFILSCAMNIGSYWFSHRLVLAMHGAKEIKRSAHPELYSMTEHLAKNAELPMPKLYIFTEQSPNAFATGRNPENGVVAVSTGILDLLTPQELRGVIAHELAHIKNRDMFLSTMAASLAGALSIIVEFTFGLGAMFMPRNDDNDGPNPLVGLALLIVTPLIGMMIQMALSRSREFYADETGAKIAGDAKGLASALRKLGLWTQHARGRLQVTPRKEAVAHMYIANHFQGLGQMFSTHPPMEERIKRLEQIKI